MSLKPLDPSAPGTLARGLVTRYRELFIPMSESQALSERHFSIWEKVGFGVLYVCLTLTLVSIGSHTVRAYYEGEFTQQSDYMAQSLGADLLQIRGVLTSLSSLHFASSDFSRDELEIYLKQLLTTYPFIQSTGRFDYIPHLESPLYVQEMREQGIYGYDIRDIVDGDQIEAALPREAYHAISAFEPLTPLTARYLGVDLMNTDARLAVQFRRAIDQNSTVFVHPPSFWDNGGSMLAFQPTYLGRQAPHNSRERASQYDGGFWLNIDLKQLAERAHLNEQGFSASICLSMPYQSQKDCLFEHRTQHSDKLLNAFFPPFQWHKVWSFGNQIVSLNLSHKVGLSRQAAVLLTSAWLVMSGLYFSLLQTIRSRRKTQAQIDRSAQQLQRERELAAVTLEAIGDAVITTDANDCISYMNPAAETLTGWAFKDARGLKVSRVAPLTPHNALSAELEGDTREQNRASDMRLQRSDSTELFVTNTHSPLYDHSGQRVGNVLVLHDVTLTRQLTQALMHQAHHDTLTGLANRRKFESTLSKLIEAQPEKQLYHGLCYIDLDQFKLVNDTCGHAAGDKLLESLSQNLQQMVRKNDLLARLGGDEFGMIIIDCDPCTAEQVAKRLYDFFQSFFFNWEGKIFAVRASIGFVPIAPDDCEMSDILAAADLACYAAKDKGRNALHVYRPEDDHMVQRKGEMRWLMRLQSALRDDGFMLYAQPICHLQDNERITRHELLLRLKEEDGSVITPLQFIQAAERYDLMREIDRWVISHAFELVKALRGTPYRQDVFCINLSGQSTTDPALPEFISAEFSRFHIDPRLICFEFTETAIIENLQHAQTLISHLHQLGCTVALDDFGAGVSSFGYLKHLKVDYLKIDGQFVREMLNNEVDREMVRSIHNIGKVLGIETIAEFVHNPATAEALKRMGISYGQGYHFGQPSDVGSSIGAQQLRVVGQ